MIPSVGLFFLSKVDRFFIGSALAGANKPGDIVEVPDRSERIDEIEPAARRPGLSQPLERMIVWRGGDGKIT